MRKTVFQEYAETISHNISSVVEITAAVLIGLAVLFAVKDYFRLAFDKSASLTQRNIRINFGSTVAVALELLLGVDVIATAIAPTWDELLPGKGFKNRKSVNLF